MRFLLFMLCWVGMASFVDYFNVPPVWAMVCGAIAVNMYDFIKYAVVLWVIGQLEKEKEKE